MSQESLSRRDQIAWDRYIANPTLRLNNEKIVSELYEIDGEIVTFIQGLLANSTRSQNEFSSFVTYIRRQKKLDINTLGRRKLADLFEEFFLL